MTRSADHFDHLARLVRLERDEERARLTEESARLPLAEREKRGHVWLDLEPSGQSVGLGGRVLVDLRPAAAKRLVAPLHVGDMVEVRPRKAEVDAPVTAVVSRASAAGAQLAFDRAPPPFVGEGRLRLDLVPNDVTVQRTLAALERWKAIDRGAAFDHRERVLARAEPRFEDPVPRTPSATLNADQAEAADFALAARDFFLVHGPPGTGKSTVLAEVVARAVERGERVLCTAASNAATDHLLELCLDRGLKALRVGHPARVAPRLVEHTLDERVEAHPDRLLARELFDEGFELLGYAGKQQSQGRRRERFANARASRSDAYQLFDEARALEKKAVRSVLGGARVVCATLASLDGAALAGESFQRVVLDEATQATEPLSLIGLGWAPVAILAGDHRQLPPTVLSARAAREGLSTSLFERLWADFPQRTAYRMLREQYRMNAEIMAFPSQESYAGELRAHPSAAGRRLDLALDAPPVLFLDTAGKGFDEASAEGDFSLFNEGESELVAAHARALIAAGLPPADLGIIAPYAAQVARLRERIDAPGVEIDTVDAFQGREKEAVLVSLTRSNGRGELGFLNDLRRINVALTRAKCHLFLAGDSGTLSTNPFYTRLIEHVQKRGGYRSAWEWP